MALPEKIKQIVIEFNKLHDDMPDSQLNINYDGDNWSYKVFAEQYKKVHASADATIAYLEALNADPVAAKAELRGGLITRIDNRIAELQAKKTELEA